MRNEYCQTEWIPGANHLNSQKLKGALKTIINFVATLGVRPRVSLTVPNRDHFVQVSLTVFWMQLPKLKTNLRIYSTESNASFTDKEFFSFGNGI